MADEGQNQRAPDDYWRNPHINHLLTLIDWRLDSVEIHDGARDSLNRMDELIQRRRADLDPDSEQHIATPSRVTRQGKMRKIRSGKQPTELCYPRMPPTPQTPSQSQATCALRVAHPASTPFADLKLEEKTRKFIRDMSTINSNTAREEKGRKFEQDLLKIGRNFKRADRKVQFAEVYFERVKRAALELPPD